MYICRLLSDLSTHCTGKTNNKTTRVQQALCSVWCYVGQQSKKMNIKCGLKCGEILSGLNGSLERIWEMSCLCHPSTTYKSREQTRPTCLFHGLLLLFVCFFLQSVTIVNEVAPRHKHHNMETEVNSLIFPTLLNCNTLHTTSTIQKINKINNTVVFFYYIVRTRHPLVVEIAV